MLVATGGLTRTVRNRQHRKPTIKTDKIKIKDKTTEFRHAPE